MRVRQLLSHAPAARAPSRSATCAAPCARAPKQRPTSSTPAPLSARFASALPLTSTPLLPLCSSSCIERRHGEPPCHECLADVPFATCRPWARLRPHVKPSHLRVDHLSRRRLPSSAVRTSPHQPPLATTLPNRHLLELHPAPMHLYVPSSSGPDNLSNPSLVGNSTQEAPPWTTNSGEYPSLHHPKIRVLPHRRSPRPTPTPSHLRSPDWPATAAPRRGALYSLVPRMGHQPSWLGPCRMRPSMNNDVLDFFQCLILNPFK
jgi:hypothetical protein